MTVFFLIRLLYFLCVNFLVSLVKDHENDPIWDLGGKLEGRGRIEET